MNAKEALTSFEVIALEELVFGDDCKCESQSHTENGTVCSVRVTHKVTTVCGKGDKLLCEIAANTLNEIMALGIYLCAYCNKKPDQCWTIRPI